MRLNLSALLAAKVSLLALLTAGTVNDASATTDCVFTKKGKTWELVFNCTTDAAIVIPDGVTVDGKGFFVSIVDPPGGNFSGAAFTNSGKSANFKNFSLTGFLDLGCVANVPMGIDLNGAASKITGVTVKLFKNGNSSECPETIAIHAGNFPANPNAPYLNVTVKNSRVDAMSRGIVIDGKMNARIEGSIMNPFIASSPVERAAVAGLGGAKLTLASNNFNAIRSAGLSAMAVLLQSAGKTTIQRNTLKGCDSGIIITGGGTTTITKNEITNPHRFGVLAKDFGGSNSLITITQNLIQDALVAGIDIDTSTAAAAKNTISQNTIPDSSVRGILIAGPGNTVQKNTVQGGTGLDIENIGAGNTYKQNICDTSSGPPVDCGM